METQEKNQHHEPRLLAFRKLSKLNFFYEDEAKASVWLFAGSMSPKPVGRDYRRRLRIGMEPKKQTRWIWILSFPIPRHQRITTSICFQQWNYSPQTFGFCASKKAITKMIFADQLDVSEQWSLAYEMVRVRRSSRLCKRLCEILWKLAWRINGAWLW